MEEKELINQILKELEPVTNNIVQEIIKNNPQYNNEKDIQRINEIYLRLTTKDTPFKRMGRGLKVMGKGLKSTYEKVANSNYVQAIKAEQDAPADDLMPQFDIPKSKSKKKDNPFETKFDGGVI